MHLPHVLSLVPPHNSAIAPGQSIALVRTQSQQVRHYKHLSAHLAAMLVAVLVMVWKAPFSSPLCPSSQTFQQMIGACLEGTQSTMRC
jgi:hypothetical protein